MESVLPDGTLLIVPDKTGAGHYWEGKWRWQGRQVKRRIGRAHVTPRPAPLTPGDGERVERWRLNYAARRGRPADGALTPAGARDKLTVLIAEHADHVAAAELAAARALADGPSLDTFGALADDWLQERAHDAQDGELKRSTLRDYRSMLRRTEDPMSARGTRRNEQDGGRVAWLMRTFEHEPVHAITAEDVEQLDRTLRAAGLTPRTRTKYTGLLSQLFDHAVRRKVIDANPLAARERRKGKRARKPMIAVYSLDTVELIAQEAGGPIGEIIRLAALTGLRQGELLALRWAAIQWAESSIVVRERYYPDTEHDAPADAGEDVPKSNQARTVPLSDQAAVVLERVSRRDEWTGPDDLVFGQRDGDPRPRARTPYVWTFRDSSDVRKTYARARDAVLERHGEPLPKLRFHDLRHTFGSRCAAEGIPLSTLQRWMGHAAITTTMVYVHWQPQHDDAARLTRAFGVGVTRPSEAAPARPA